MLLEDWLKIEESNRSIPASGDTDLMNVIDDYDRADFRFSVTRERLLDMVEILIDNFDNTDEIDELKYEIEERERDIEKLEEKIESLESEYSELLSERD